MKKYSICIIILLIFLFLVFSTTVWANEAIDTEGVRIAIIDSGFNPNHPDLINLKVKAGAPTFTDRLKEFLGWPFGELPLSHGNAAASIISESAGKDKGAELYGYHVNAFDNFKDILRAAVDDGVNIINVSLDSGNISLEEKRRMQAELDEFLQREEEMQNVIIVAAAGNSNKPIDDEPLQGLAEKYDNIIVVGSVDQQGKPSSFTSYGAGVTIAAPGENIWVARSGIGFTNNYSYQSGTSYSAPFVTGIIAQMLAANPDLTPGEIKVILKSTAESYQGDNNKALGEGIINVEKAVARAIDMGLDVVSEIDEPEPKPEPKPEPEPEPEPESEPVQQAKPELDSDTCLIDDCDRRTFMNSEYCMRHRRDQETDTVPGREPAPAETPTPSREQHFCSFFGCSMCNP